MNGTATFAPDLNPLTPGILVDGTDFYPSESGGVRPVPSPVSIGNALAAECLGICAFRDTDMSFRTIAGTASKLYQLSYVTWSDVSLAGDYATAGRWDFAAYGNYVLAANFQKKLQVQTSSGTAFAEISEAPVSKFVTVAQEFVICANVSSYPSRVQWCAQGDYDEWTEALSTQAGYMDLVDSQGILFPLYPLQPWVGFLGGRRGFPGLAGEYRPCPLLRYALPGRDLLLNCLESRVGFLCHIPSP